MVKQLLWGCLLVGASCSTPEASVETSSSEATEVLNTNDSGRPSLTNAPVPLSIKGDFLNSTQFKQARQDTFRVDSDTEKLVELTAEEERKYLQQNVEHVVYKPYHFYAVQENTSARKVITLLSYDGEYKTDMLRLVYNAQNKLVGRQIVAYNATEGEILDEAYGWFESPTAFRFIQVNERAVEETDVHTKFVLDSLVTRYSVQKEQFSIQQKKNYQHRRRVSSALQ